MNILSPQLNYYTIGMLDQVLLKEAPQASQLMAYEDMFTYIHKMK